MLSTQVCEIIKRAPRLHKGIDEVFMCLVFAIIVGWSGILYQKGVVAIVGLVIGSCGFVLLRRMVIYDHQAIKNYTSYLKDDVLSGVPSEKKIDYLDKILDELREGRVLTQVSTWFTWILTCLVAIQASLLAFDSVRISAVIAASGKNRASILTDIISGMSTDYATFVTVFASVIIILIVCGIYSRFFSKLTVIRKSIYEVIYELLKK